MRHFLELNQWHYAALPIAAYVAKMVVDLFKMVRSTNVEYKSVSVDDAVGCKWHEIRDGIAKELDEL